MTSTKEIGSFINKSILNRTETVKVDQPFKRYLCLGCGFLYDEELGLPHGLAPGTRWEDVPADWACPDCGTPKHLFEMVEIPYVNQQPALSIPNGAFLEQNITNHSFLLRDSERGYNKYLSTGEASSYISGHPEAVLTRHSSFNFHEYQSGRSGFGRMRVFGQEVFSGSGCGYNMHPHHDFIICALVLQGQLTHINTVGNIDQLMPGDYYVFSAGSGGKHCELNLKTEDMHAIYIWFLPDHLMVPPSYNRSHFDAQRDRNRLVTLVGEADGGLPIPQDVRISRLVTDTPLTQPYRPASAQHGVYVFVIEGEAECGSATLRQQDSIGLWGVEEFNLRTGPTKTDVLFVETIM